MSTFVFLSAAVARALDWTLVDSTGLVRPSNVYLPTSQARFVWRATYMKTKIFSLSKLSNKATPPFLLLFMVGPVTFIPIKAQSVSSVSSTNSVWVLGWDAKFYWHNISTWICLLLVSLEEDYMYSGRNIVWIKFCVSAKNFSRLLTTPTYYVLLTYSVSQKSLKLTREYTLIAR